MRSSLKGAVLMKWRSAIEGRAKQDVRNDIQWRENQKKDIDKSVGWK
jgi:hypothetical protein